MADEPDESDWEEQETFVVVELSGVLETDLLQKSEGNCKILGVGTDKPLLQLDSYTFTGEYEDTLGTNILFEEKSHNGDNASEEVPHTKQEQNHLEFATTVTKKLFMTRAFITPKIEESAEKKKDSADQQ